VFFDLDRREHGPHAVQAHSSAASNCVVRTTGYYLCAEVGVFAAEAEVAVGLAARVAAARVAAARVAAAAAAAAADGAFEVVAAAAAAAAAASKDSSGKTYSEKVVTSHQLDLSDMPKLDLTGMRQTAGSVDSFAAVAAVAVACGSVDSFAVVAAVAVAVACGSSVDSFAAVAAAVAVACGSVDSFAAVAAVADACEEVGNLVVSAPAAATLV
jgi:hypothetical protein